MGLYKRNKYILMILLLVLIIVTMSGCTKTNLLDYVEVNYSGLNEEAHAYATVDEQSLVRDTFDFGKAVNDMQYSEMFREMSNMLDSYKVEVIPNKNLRNGDKVEVIVTVNSEKSKKLSEKSKEMVVVGLKDRTPISDQELKDNTSVSFSGYSGYGKILIHNNFTTHDMKYLNFEVKQNGTLKNGDNVTVKVQNPNYLIERDYKLSESGSFSVKVEGLEPIVPITDKILKNNTSVSFEGISGRGQIYIENNFTERDLRSIEFDAKQSGKLKNGDEVLIRVKNPHILSNTKYELSESASFSVKAEGLEPIVPITDQELKDSVLIMYSGSSGKGEIRIDNNFKNPDLQSLTFISEQNGKIKNDEDVVIIVENAEKLSNTKYEFSESGSFTVKAKDLKIIPKDINDIANFDVVTRLLTEYCERSFNSQYSVWDYEYIDTYYRDFYEKGNSFYEKESYRTSPVQETYGDGVLVHLLKIIYRSTGTERFQLVGFPSVTVDEDGIADLLKLLVEDQYFDNKYSLDLVLLKLESEGFIKQDYNN